MAQLDIHTEGDLIVLKGEDDEGCPFQVRLGEEPTLKLAIDLAEAAFEVFRRNAGHDRIAKPLVVLRDGRVGVGTVGGKLYLDIAGGARRAWARNADRRRRSTNC